MNLKTLEINGEIFNFEINQDEIIKIILEIQHELHIAEDPEEINLRSKQLRKLIDSVKKYYGLSGD